MRIVQDEGLVGVVYVENAVRARADVEHNDFVYAEQEVPEALVAASRLEGERVVNGEVAAEGSAGVGLVEAVDWERE